MESHGVLLSWVTGAQQMASSALLAATPPWTSFLEVSGPDDCSITKFWISASWKNTTHTPQNHFPPLEQRAVTANSSPGEKQGDAFPYRLWRSVHLGPVIRQRVVPINQILISCLSIFLIEELIIEDSNYAHNRFSLFFLPLCHKRWMGSRQEEQVKCDSRGKRRGKGQGEDIREAGEGLPHVGNEGDCTKCLPTSPLCPHSSCSMLSILGGGVPQ